MLVLDVHSSVSTRTNVIIAILAQDIFGNDCGTFAEMHMQTSKMSAHIHRAQGTALGRERLYQYLHITAEGDGERAEPEHRGARGRIVYTGMMLDATQN